MIAARAQRAQRVVPEFPRAALVRAAEAAAQGTILRIPPGFNAVFVPADSLPCALPGTPVDDVVAFLVPESDVDAARRALSPPRRKEELLSLSSSSQKSAALVAELDTFLKSQPLHQRWRVIEETVKNEAKAAAAAAAAATSATSATSAALSQVVDNVNQENDGV